MATLQCIKEHNMMEVWGDSLGSTYFDGKIHGIGQARQAVFASARHYVWDTDGTRLYNYDAPFTPSAEMNISQILPGKLVVMGGTIASEIWEFNPSVAGYTAGSWTQISSNFTAAIGTRIMAPSADLDGWFYIFGGWNNSTVYKTQNFTSWTLVGNLPAPIDKISACGCCVYDGRIFLIGGATGATTTVNFPSSAASGHVYAFDPSDNSFTLILTDKEKFGTVWIDAVANDTEILVVKGYMSGDQYAAYSSPPATVRVGNNRGVLTSTDGGSTWSSVSVTDGTATMFERHRAGVVNVNGALGIIAGFGANDYWLYRAAAVSGPYYTDAAEVYVAGARQAQVRS